MTYKEKVTYKGMEDTIAAYEEGDCMVEKDNGEIVTVRRNDGLLGIALEKVLNLRLADVMPSTRWGFRFDGAGRRVLIPAGQGREDIVLPSGKTVEVKTGGSALRGGRDVQPRVTADWVVWVPHMTAAKLRAAFYENYDNFYVVTGETFNRALACSTRKTVAWKPDNANAAHWGIQVTTLQAVLEDEYSDELYEVWDIE